MSLTLTPVRSPLAKAKQTIDPAFLARARELRDRWMERVNGWVDALPAPVGKYEVARGLTGPVDAARAMLPAP